MNCPQCNASIYSRGGAVIDTRDGRRGAIRRRRVCENGHRFTTTETIVGHEVEPEVKPISERLREIAAEIEVEESAEAR